MINGGAANLGGVDILGLKLELGRMIDVLNVFVPVIKQSSVEGYQSGLIVQSEGINAKDACVMQEVCRKTDWWTDLGRK